MNDSLSRPVALALMFLLGLTVFLAGFLGIELQHAYAVPRAQVRGNIRAAAAHYHLSAAKTRWIVAKGVHIVFVGHTGHGESGGHVSSGHPGGCYGLFQFGRSWKHKPGMGMAPGHHHIDWRRCGKCSCWRFVKVYKIAGRRGIKKHWRATY
jgi:hypothetical protein